MTEKIKWIWQCQDWPHFSYDADKLKSLEEEFIHKYWRYDGAHMYLSDSDKINMTINIMSQEALKTSEIEGEYLNRDSLQSSIGKNFGLLTDLRKINPAEYGVSEMMIDLYKNFSIPLTHDQLFQWHRMLMNGRQDLKNIGSYRTHEEEMQIISGRIDKPTIHFEAPASKQVMTEMEQFIEWFNNTSPSGKTPLPYCTRASIAHLYFETIHPFEDGNGRIGRAIAEKVIAQSLRQPFLSTLSQTICNQRKEYYNWLEKSNKSTVIDHWIIYFTNVILTAQTNSFKLLEFLIQKTKFYDKHHHHLNERQAKVLERIFREGYDGFKGDLSANNYLKITNTSRATATRDLADMMEKNILSKYGTGKGTRYRVILSQ